MSKFTQTVSPLIARLIECVGENLEDDSVRDTPERVAKAWELWTAGYHQDPRDIIRYFTENGYDEMILLREIPVYSHCLHHLAPIFGTATVAYIPDKRVLGLSKISRLVDIFARRLQLQERMTVQIADALFDPENRLKPLGVGVIMKCRHFCMEARGINRAGIHTVTSALRGVMATGEPRAEFLRLAET